MKININEGIEILKDEVKKTDSQLQQAMVNYPIATPIAIAIGLFVTALYSFPDVEFTIKNLVNAKFSFISLSLCIIVVLSTVVKWNRLNPKIELDLKVSSKIAAPFIIHGTYSTIVGDLYKWTGLCGNHLPYLVQYHHGTLSLWFGVEGKQPDSVTPDEYTYSWSEVIERDDQLPTYKKLSNTTVQRCTSSYLKEWKL